MTKPQFVTLTVLLAVLVALNALPLFKAGPIGAKPSFEYRVEGIPDVGFDDKMAALGSDGWELVFARRASDGGDTMMYEVILQRAK